MATNDGGPAFPTALIEGSVRGRETGGDEGMSLRDYMAAKAMAAMVANPNTNTGASDVAGAAKAVAGWAYQIADAMLSAREAKP